MYADQVLAAVFELHDSALSRLSERSWDVSDDSSDLWLSSDSLEDEDGDSDDSLNLDDEQEGSTRNDTSGDDLNDSSDRQTLNDRLVNIFLCYVQALGLNSSQIS